MNCELDFWYGQINFYLIELHIVTIISDLKNFSYYLKAPESRQNEVYSIGNPTSGRIK